MTGPVPPDPVPLLSLRGLSKTYLRRDGLLTRPRAVAAARDVTLDIARGEVLGIVGESGSGKSTVGRMAMRLLEPTAGAVHLDGADITHLSEQALRPLRHKMQMIFQDPSASLNPRQSIRQILTTPLRLRGVAGADATQEMLETLALVGLGPDVLGRAPSTFSGGQRQRLSIARALLMKPELIVADEAVSALDVCVQAQIVNLFRHLRDRFNLSILFIGHDLAVVGVISDRIAVMYRGTLVEIAPTEQLFRRPRHPYTARLLSAEPRRGVLSAPAPPATPAGQHAPDGCVFSARCPHAADACRTRQPALAPVAPGHRAACIRTDLDLEGILPHSN
ncbi:oligopeptide/dipeptide ABC transporter ATP-binding protein [Gluconacetobacter tumulisoli]|uniref:ABC transporter ATP-binding protein n=1 Tax=Gluconacetobacter tumulisoli TaxID=1286189 RepID=A0A7W4K888_9PROT|nr:oligopeptide/dipeptide ABC transporter ATP-binding protein [Gluconacetobacter tumulisoli]MBB2202080.1 ABC transporter ATP-binding protein [Gluconacetobacter tumulisoli]